MALHTWLIYLTAVFGLSLTPGPNGLLALTHGALYGHRRALWTVTGGMLGFVLLMALSMFGLAALLKASAHALLVLKWLGAAYLIWLGIGMLRSRKVDPQQVVAAPPLSDWQALRVGFLTNALNPKTTLFVVALFTQVISPDTATLTQLGYGLFMAAAHLFWFALVALGLGLAASSLQRS